MTSVPQIVPSKVCLSCDVCCRFPEQDSFLRPFFTRSEIRWAIEHGMESKYFSNPDGCQVAVVPHPLGEGYLCPAFDPETSYCRIYEVRPLDCQIYPFVLMWDREHQSIVLGWDTKCPFLSPLRSESNVPQDVSRLRILPTLPTEVMDAANRLVTQLEDGELQSCVTEHPNFVTPFQDDVMALHPLQKLTQSVGSENA